MGGARGQELTVLRERPLLVKELAEIYEREYVLKFNRAVGKKMDRLRQLIKNFGGRRDGLMNGLGTPMHAIQSVLGHSVAVTEKHDAKRSPAAASAEIGGG